MPDQTGVSAAGQTVPTAKLPPGVRRELERAEAHGWAAAVTAAEGPPPNLALRVHRGRLTAWALWTWDGRGVRFKSAAVNVIPTGRLSTLAAFRRLIETPADAVDAWLSA